MAARLFWSAYGVSTCSGRPEHLYVWCNMGCDLRLWRVVGKRDEMTIARVVEKELPRLPPRWEVFLAIGVRA